MAGGLHKPGATRYALAPGFHIAAPLALRLTNSRRSFVACPAFHIAAPLALRLTNSRRSFVACPAFHIAAPLALRLTNSDFSGSTNKIQYINAPSDRRPGIACTLDQPIQQPADVLCLARN